MCSVQLHSLPLNLSNLTINLTAVSENFISAAVCVFVFVCVSVYVCVCVCVCVFLCDILLLVKEPSFTK